ncbi:hypothetical protein [Candidatus Absconditicoccus praedator]|uniref:hypothetical protein n=1 Tax=Candidatus Absconditicoccus praedator TaxID=2735562 RepID=UPI001E560FC3|nr:hypothetical protein [Candidatus Absconditicoccus praedator]UFX83318.1 hypothetical protein HLG78_04285 [Candidatus Absconditicoccus praedator]
MLKKIVKNKLNYTFYLVLLVFGIGIIIFTYNFGVSHINYSQAESISSEINEYEERLDSKKEDENLTKFILGEKIIQNNYKYSWIEKYENMIEIFDKIRDIEGRNIQLENYDISESYFAVDGIVSSLENVYDENGVLSRLKEFDFVEKIDVDTYQKANGDYSFSLEIKIKTNE